MLNLFAKRTAAILLSVCLAGCVTQRDRVLAPSASGVVIDVANERPLEGAEVRFVGPDTPGPVITGADGRFMVEGRTLRRVVLAYPIGGVYRDSISMTASAPDLADGHASADFLNFGRPASAIHDIAILMFPSDAADTPLHVLMADCVSTAQGRHALHLATYVSTLDPDDPPNWLTPDRAEAISGHLDRVLAYSRFQSCRRGSEAYALYAAATDRLTDIVRAGRGQNRPTRR